MATEHGRDLAAALAELLPGWTVYRDRVGTVGRGLSGSDPERVEVEGGDQ